MIIIIPPARAMNLDDEGSYHESVTKPIFQNQADYLAQLMKSFSVQDFMDQMHISKDLAKKAYFDFQNFENLAKKAKPALFAYDGSLYKKMMPQNYTPSDLHYAQSHLRIISTLYGVLRPMDLIEAYRMSFYLHIPNLNAPNLFKFWEKLITQQINKDAQNSGKMILYLGVEEMLKVVNFDDLSLANTIIEVAFKDKKDGEWKEIRAYAKPAKAQMINDVIKGKIEKLDTLKIWNWGGYHYNKNLSNSRKWTFTRSSILTNHTS